MSEKLVKSRKTDRYFCVFCFGDKLFDDKNKCEKHLRHHLIGSKSEESHGIDLWIERHLRYQESLSKSMSEPIKTIPDRSRTLYRGCHVCDCIIKVYDIRDEPFPSGTNIHEITIRNLNIHYSGNNVNHINPHLRYYPFECLICQNEFDKSHKRGDPEVKELMKTGVESMMRIHVKEKHFKNWTLDRDELEEKIDKSIRTLKVTELEKLIKKGYNFDKKVRPLKRKSIVRYFGELKAEPKHINTLVPDIVKSFTQTDKVMIDSTLKSALKTTKRDQMKNKRKCVSFSQEMNKRIERFSEPKTSSLDLRNFEDSDDEQLIVDLSQESDPSLSDSADSYDEMRADLKNSNLDFEGTNHSQISNKSNDWSNCFDEEKGDPNRVIEITIDSDVEDKCEIIVPQSVMSEHKEKDVVKHEIMSSPTTSSRVDANYGDIDCVSNLRESESDEIQANKKYYCVLCPAMLDSKESSLEHYLGHCGLYLECGECHEKFSSLQSFRGHNSQHLERNNMWNLEQFLNAKKWCDHYIGYIEKNDHIFKQVINVNKVFCPVCHKLFQLFDIIGVTYNAKDDQKLIDEDFISNHLHQHLQYFPYECIDCKFDDKKTAFCLNDKARHHILAEHNVQNAHQLNFHQLKTYFHKRKSIQKLDNVIINSINISMKMKSIREKFNQFSDKTL